MFNIYFYKNNLNKKASNNIRCFFFIALSFLYFEGFSQTSNVYGYVFSENNKPIEDVEIYDKEEGFLLSKTNEKGFYNFTTIHNNLEVTFFSANYNVFSKKINVVDSLRLDVNLKEISIALDEVEIQNKRIEIFSTRKIDDVVETSIYAAKKTEAILIDDKTTSLALNNARKIYSKVAGLNVYENDDAGLQLNIGGRGLDPNRTSNFNTRQNGYDISADVLGYPESYYTPAGEALERIEVVRGAASLQYGTQFGGLINFKLKDAPKDRVLEFVSRNTIGSNSLLTNFISLAGTNNDVSYYTFFNRKEGMGFRENSSFYSSNIYGKVTKSFKSNLTLSLEVTYLDYLAQQAGGLTDYMFEEDPYQSNRARNWFAVNWLLYNLKIEHIISDQTIQKISFFGLEASRDALGFRTNRVDQVDIGSERDLISGQFKNFGLEYRLLHEDKILKYNTVSLLGVKLYKANNSSRQGPGSADDSADFDFQNDNYPYYTNQSEYKYPNLNISVFGENIFYLNDKFSITPGFRFEHIDTRSDGYYRQINLDGASNPIWDTIIFDNRDNKRDFFLFGLGLSYKHNTSCEFYANASQNYRSVTFADISIINPAFVINPDIQDEDGYTIDLGLRGNINNILYYDLTTFQLMYNNRIGFVQKVQDDGNVKSERGNVGDARILGIESLINFNFKNILPDNYIFSCFLNTSFIESQYVKSEVPGIEGKKVEFIPRLNTKTGMVLGYKNIEYSIQYAYLSEQYTDASNAVESNISGVIGQIPAYQIIDITLLSKFKRYTLEAGINNFLNTAYFTRRATGYPGPGIIPSPPRNYYLTLEIRL